MSTRMVFAGDVKAGMILVTECWMFKCPYSGEHGDDANHELSVLGVRITPEITKAIVMDASGEQHSWTMGSVFPVRILVPDTTEDVTR